MAAKTSKTNTYSLDTQLQIQDIYRVTEDLKKRMDKGKEYILDFTPCEKIDLAVIQILISFCKQAIAENKIVHVKGPFHPNLSQILEDADLVRIVNGTPKLFPQIGNGGYPIES